jgi:hypothetical protein
MTFKRFIGYFSSALILAVAILSFQSIPAASALDNTFPDQGGINAGEWVLLSQYGNGHLLETPRAWIRVFYDTQNANYAAQTNFKVSIKYDCRTSGTGYDVDFRFAPDLGSSKHIGDAACNGGNLSGGNYISTFELGGISKSDLQSDPARYTDRYKYIDVYAVNHAQPLIAFRVTALDTWARATFREALGGQSATYENDHANDPYPTTANYRNNQIPDLGSAFGIWNNTANDGVGTVHDYALRYKSSCSYTKDKVALRWYDADDGEANQTENNGGIKFIVTDLTAMNNPGSPITPGFGSDYKMTFPNANMTSLGGDDVYKDVIIDVLPSHNYEWRWTNVSAPNGVQMWTPFSEFNTQVQCNQDPVGRFYSLQCSYMVVDAYDQDDGKHVAGSSDGKVVQVKVITGNGTQIQDTSGSSSPGTPYANDVWAGDGWDSGGYAVSNQYNGTGTDSWKDFVDKHLSNSSISLSLYALDKEVANRWVKVDTATFDATACNPPIAGCTLNVPSLIQPGESFTITATVTYSPDPPSGATITVNTPGLSPTSKGATAATGGKTVFSWSSTASAANNYSTNYSISGTSLSGPCTTIPVVDLSYFKVFGGDVEVGGDFEGTSCTNPAGEGKLSGWYSNGSPMFGASTQFAATALGQIIGVNSAHGSAPSPPAGLTFANRPVSDIETTFNTNYSAKLGGNFGTTQCLFNPTLPSATPLNASSASAGTSPLNGDGTFSVPAAYTPFTLGSGNFAPPHHVTLYVNGNVFISGNVIYNGDGSWNLNSSATPPSFMLVATGSIYIAPTVTELNGIYMAKGNIYTCATSAGNPVSSTNLFDVCNRQLLVHGSFVARHLNFMRTVGTLNDSLNGGLNESRESAGRGSCKNQQLSAAPTQPSLRQCAGEVFDFSPEMYLSEWEIMPEGNGAVQYDSLTSLPPVL